MKVEAVVGTHRSAVGYLVYEHVGGPALIVDAPIGSTPYYLDAIRKHQVTPLYIICTHGHWDQIADNPNLADAIGAPICAHAWDSARLANPALGTEDPKEYIPQVKGRSADRYLHEGETIVVGDIALTVMHTPGHTPGSICLYEPNAHALFSGDLLGRQGVGRVDFPGGNEEKRRESLLRLAELPDDTRVFPGHGMPTTLQKERWLLDLAKLSIPK